MTPALRRGWGVLASVCALIVLTAAIPAVAALTFPPLTGRVVDNANMLSPQTEQDLSARLEALETKTGRQAVVATVPSLQGQEIEDYGYQLGRAWGIGSKARNDGLVFIVAPNERKVRIEVGYGLEGVMTDALSSVILQERVLPKFRSGDMEGGVVAGTDAIVQQLSLDDGEARTVAAQAAQAKASTGKNPGIGAIVVFLVIFLLFSSLFRRRGGGLLPWLILGGMSSGGGGGGGWSSGGGGGGGFSGGGGSFGGGGSSGGW
ncbi:MAG: TPM domain-containing protein [Caulobacteraceae bacterium]